MPGLLLIAPLLLQATLSGAGHASACIAPAPGGEGVLGILRNRCEYRVVAHMCVVGPPARNRHLFFDCARGQAGSYDLEPQGEAPAIFRGAGRVHWFACRFPEFLPRNVQYHAGKGLSGRCE